MSEVTTPTLADFLLARIAEDEAAARGATEPFLEGDRTGLGPLKTLHPMLMPHLWRWTPARVLAECKAKRRVVGCAKRNAAASRTILDAFAEDDSPRARIERAHYAAAARAWSEALNVLAEPYADHPDFREEWKPCYRVNEVHGRGEDQR